MNWKAIISFIIYISGCTIAGSGLHGQEIPAQTQSQIETLSANDAGTDDDAETVRLEDMGRHHVNVNYALKSALEEIPFLTDIQIESLLQYRSLFGKLLSVFELQAIPGWTIDVIRQVLPFISVDTRFSPGESLPAWFRNGEHSVLLRFGSLLARQKGYQVGDEGAAYAGSSMRILLRYRYTYKDELEWGVLGDKDAGEKFLKGGSASGFDFYSFHLFARRMGRVQALAIGDFTVNMGQGLIQWQSLAFKKSAATNNIKRQSAVLRPYNSSGEYNFQRGIGICLKKGFVETNLFMSLRKLSAGVERDSNGHAIAFTSLQTAGYHRTETEMRNRNRVKKFSAGVNIQLNKTAWHIGLNAIYEHFSLDWLPSEEPYRLFTFRGNRMMNASIDYAGNFRNIHFFGELAMDQSKHIAMLNGMLMSVDSRVDLSLVFRKINAGYQSDNANAFTENTTPVNEKGIYVGMEIRPVNSWRVNAYADFFQFPWLKYQVSRPSSGSEWLLQVTFTPSRKTEMYWNFRSSNKEKDEGDEDRMKFPSVIHQRSSRFHFSHQLTAAISMKERIELCWVGERPNQETGFLSFVDFLYKPMMKAWSLVVRFQYFETDSYDSRLYAFENDVLYGYAVPVFYLKGLRTYAVINYDINRRLSCWLRLATTLKMGAESFGSGNEEVEGSSRPDWKLQFRYRF